MSWMRDNLIHENGAIDNKLHLGSGHFGALRVPHDFMEAVEGGFP